MGGIFNYDNKFFRTVDKLVDCVWLSVLWVLFSIPIITSGAASTALYYTVNKVIMNDRGYLWREFWGAFKANFKQSTIVWIILMVLYVTTIGDCYIMYTIVSMKKGVKALYIIFFILVAVLVVWTTYLFPYIARFNDSTRRVLKNTFWIATDNLKGTTLLLPLFMIAVVLCFNWPITVTIIPALYMVCASKVLEKTFRKYMSPEDLEAEAAQNLE